MKSIGTSRVDSAITLYSTELTKHEKKLKRALAHLKKGVNTQDQKKYVQKLHDLGIKVITANPQQLSKLKKEFNSIKTLDPNRKADQKFKEKILTAMGYKYRRSDFYPLYFQSLGIKSCVYCNSQLCVTVESSSKDLIAKFQVDHFWPKDEYPCFSVSLYNLYPTCASCNNKKGIKKVAFQLYKKIGSKDPSPYSFELHNHRTAVAQYLATRDPKVLKVLFNEPLPGKGNERLNELFSIEGIYNTQIDIVEELIMKKEIYTTVYKKDLLKLFNHLFKSPVELDRLILSNYVELDEIHKRPMAKFIQDIARQIDLI